MSDDPIELSRRKILAGMGTIGVASAGVGLGTSAYFSDEETFTNNTLTAGSLDLKVDWEEHYSDWSADESEGLEYDVLMSAPGEDLEVDYVGLPDPTDPLIYVAQDDLSTFMDNTAVEAYPDTDDDGVQDAFAAEPGGETEDGVLYVCEDGADTPEDLDPNGGTELRTAKGPDAPRGEATYDENGDPLPLINISDVKPGDFGELTLSFHLCDNPGYVWMLADNVQAAENGLTEPEAKDDDEDGDADSTDPADVELLDAVQTTWWYDEDGDNVLDTDGEGEQVGETADVVIVMDTSGSMGGSKINEAKAGAKQLVDSVGAGVNVGLVPFTSSASVTANLGESKSDVKDAIDDLSAGGGTDVGEGITEGQNELTGPNGRPDAAKYLVVLTNGQSSTGRSEATAAKDAGTTIYGIAYGSGADQDLIEDISSPPKIEDGTIDDQDQYAFVGDTANIGDIFDDIGGEIAVGGETVIFRGSLRESLELLTSGEGVLLDADPSTDDPDPFEASTTHYIGFAWYLPVDHANEIQTDSAGFDLGFYTEQARHNDPTTPTSTATDT